MSFTDLALEILKILPHASFGEDNDGQIVIYTNLCQSSNDDSQPLTNLDQE